MRTAKKLPAVCLLIIVCLAMPFAAHADNGGDGGSCGEGLLWNYEDGLLSISGNGEMGADIPWAGYAALTERIFIADGVELINDAAFVGFDAVISCRCTALHRQAEGLSVTWEYRHGADLTQAEVIEPNCTMQGYTVHVCAECFQGYCDDYTAPLGHLPVTDPALAPTCTAPGCTAGEHCGRCGFVMTEQVPLDPKGHTAVTDPAVEPTCTEPGRTEGSHCADCGLVFVSPMPLSPKGHAVITEPAVEPTCTEPGFTEGSYCAECGFVFATQIPLSPKGHTVVTEPAVEPTCTGPGRTEGSYCAECGLIFASPMTLSPAGHGYEDGTCTRCGAADPDYKSGFTVQFDFDEGAGMVPGAVVEIDGAPYTVGGDLSVTLENGDAETAVVFTYSSGDTDPHKVYPTGMRVWLLDFDGSSYTARRRTELDDLLQYSGASIRITGKRGIRMISSVPTAAKSALTADGIGGWKLYEYGTLAAWASELGQAPLTPDFASVKSAFAYRRGEADPIYALKDGLTQYTNVLVGFTEAQCVPDLVMRPYAVLENADGERIVILGGTIRRSIGYIAWQNRGAFAPGSSSYKYIWSIIHTVYGSAFDSEYKG